MAKAKSIYSCAECGATSPKWQGQCPGCGAWNTLVETLAESAVASSSRFAALAGTAGVQALSEIEAREADRLPTGIGEFDRALGGGLVAGGVILLGGNQARQLLRRLVGPRLHQFKNGLQRERAGHVALPNRPNKFSILLA